jgi:nicotinate-nucleotide pyrophosphorylase (carboxylating)
MTDLDIEQAVQANVAAALAEDLGIPLSPALTQGETATGGRFSMSATGDLTARLIAAEQTAQATLVTREDAILCGIPWFEACFRTLDRQVRITWNAQEGSRVTAGATLCKISGNARALLSAERPALNFLQTLSATATTARRYVDAVSGTHAVIMDTRKTLPGLRIAQKYAVKIGGGRNQRVGLFDGILIKENHIAAAGGIPQVMDAARKLAAPGIGIQIEVENLEQLQQALDAGATLVLLDNFNLDQMREAVRLTAGRAQLEASGGIAYADVRAIAETGVDRISIGSLTKTITAVDLSLRISA